MESGMDNKLKQRLLGVTVLVMLAVIIVPELVREPAPQTKPVAVESAPSPPADSQNQVTTISLPEPETPPAEQADVTELRRGNVTLTPLKFDLTEQALLKAMPDWNLKG